MDEGAPRLFPFERRWCDILHKGVTNSLRRIGCPGRQDVDKVVHVAWFEFRENSITASMIFSLAGRARPQPNKIERIVLFCLYASLLFSASAWNAATCKETAWRTYVDQCLPAPLGLCTANCTYSNYSAISDYEIQKYKECLEHPYSWPHAKNESDFCHRQMYHPRLHRYTWETYLQEQIGDYILFFIVQVMAFSVMTKPLFMIMSKLLRLRMDEGGFLLRWLNFLIMFLAMFIAVYAWWYGAIMFWYIRGSDARGSAFDMARFTTRFIYQEVFMLTKAVIIGAVVGLYVVRPCAPNFLWTMFRFVFL